MDWQSYPQCWHTKLVSDRTLAPDMMTITTLEAVTLCHSSGGTNYGMKIQIHGHHYPHALLKSNASYANHDRPINSLTEQRFVPMDHKTEPVPRDEVNLRP